MTEQDCTTPTPPVEIEPAVWKKLGITQAFDLLLVKACYSSPSTPVELRTQIGASLASGAQKFWDMSFQELTRGLKRQEVLIEHDALLKLHPNFIERLDRAVDTVSSGKSRVAPTEGVSLETIEARAKARELRAEREREAKAKSRTTSRTAHVRPAKRPQASDDPDPLGHQIDAPKSTPIQPPPVVSTTPPKSPAKKLFTSIRLNRLFDRLEHAPLSVKQLTSKLDLNTTEMETFLAVCEAAELIRIIRSDLVELHWRGRDYARTADADRRMSVLSLVKELRSAFEGEN
ncbi:MAG: hypothetical protein ACPGQS_14040 [Bradymonadia bacterium]